MQKVTLASREWVSTARGILEALASERGAEDDRFSLCEVFTDAPPGLAGDASGNGRAAWHFRIHGKNVTVSEGEADDVDAKVVMDYQATLPNARRIIEDPPDGEPAESSLQPDQITGDMSRAPAYLREVHNGLAVLTA